MSQLQAFEFLAGASLASTFLMLGFCVYKFLCRPDSMTAHFVDMLHSMRYDKSPRLMAGNSRLSTENPFNDSFLDGNDPGCALQPGNAPMNWYPLLGHRIALADTGFEISLEQSGRMSGHFILWSPEGKGLFAGANLDELKEVAETQAKFRSEFKPVTADFELPRPLPRN
ncbi:MAG: hypothetical protein EPN72_15035 [Nevskiaceae bacterium]|nr:MAG: hypothetical protein EPN72_15035 [Nevskiaceae bacterium]